MQTQTNIQFGSGVFVFTPNAGNLAANPTPIQLKVLQEASVEFKGDLKKLFGQKQIAVATARGKIDISGKCKVAALDQNDINQIYWGQTQTAGGNLPTFETHTPAASVTPTAAAGAGIVTDLGVINGSTGLSMLKVPSAPAVGQYSFTPATTGGSPTPAAYIFNAAETAASVQIAFQLPVTTGSTLSLTSQLMGYAPVCAAMLYNSFRSAVSVVTLNSVTLGMMSIPTKQEDFWVSDLDFSANADAAGNIGTLYNS
jgi:hypothetical protein